MVRASAPQEPSSACATSSMMTGKGAADFGLKLGGADAGRGFHEAGEAFLLHLFGHGAGQGVGGRAGDGFVGEGADAIELGFLEPLQEVGEVRLRLPGKPTMNVERTAMSGTAARQAARRSRTRASLAGRRMARSTVGEACWNGMSR
jgi:hypothetical protein